MMKETMKAGKNVHLIILFIFFSGFISTALARQSGYGRVNMSGSIMDTPCAIAMEDLDQTFDFGVVTTGQIMHEGRGGEHKFSLNLIGCDLHPQNTSKNDWSVFETTFDGPTKNGFFSVSGASGIGLQILDSTGRIATPGKALTRINLVPGSQRVEYILQLVSDHENIKPGAYHSTLRFKIDYF